MFTVNSLLDGAKIRQGHVGRQSNMSVCVALSKSC